MIINDNIVLEIIDNILHFIPEFEDDILSQQNNFEHQDEMTFSSTMNLRHTRELNTADMNSCVNSQGILKTIFY